MSTPEDQLRETFLAHEELAPDAAAVYARVQELSRTYKWRRRGAAAAGGVVVGAGLIAGIVTIPSVLHSQPAIAPAASAPAVPSLSPSPSPSPSITPDAAAREREAYFAAGYDLETAQQLAALWHMAGDVGQAKIEAGRRLLDGQSLPVAPPTDAQLQAYLGAGYGYDDAVRLAKMWHLEPDKAKIKAGGMLLKHRSLPFKPLTPAPPTTTSLENKQVQAFFDAGYTTTDAAKLADLWHTQGPYEAKVEGGKRLLAGQTLPIKP